MMTQEEKLNYVQKIFQAGLGAGVFRTVKQWAELLEVDKSGLSSALNGSERNLTDSLVRKIERWAKDYLPEADNSKTRFVLTNPKEQVSARGIFLPEETRAMYENMSETIKIQAQIIAQMQGQLSTSVPFPAKNTYLEKRLDK